MSKTNLSVVKMGRLFGVFNNSLLVNRRGFTNQSDAVKFMDDIQSGKIKTYYDDKGVLMVGSDPRKEAK